MGSRVAVLFNALVVRVAKSSGEVSTRTPCDGAHMLLVPLPEAESNSVRLIGGAGGPLQVIEAVIRLISVFVVHLLSSCGRTQECSRNDAVNRHRYATIRQVQPNSLIAVTKVRAKGVANGPSFGTNARGGASYLTEARNLVPPIGTVHQPPLFGHEMILTEKVA